MSYLTSSQTWGLLTRLRNELASLTSSVTPEGWVDAINSNVVELQDRLANLISDCSTSIDQLESMVNTLVGRPTIDIETAGSELVIRWFTISNLESLAIYPGSSTNKASQTFEHGLGLTSSVAFCTQYGNPLRDLFIGVASSADEVTVTFNARYANQFINARVLVIGYR